MNPTTQVFWAEELLTTLANVPKGVQRSPSLDSESI
jgi:hypothetical protein